MYRIMMDGSVFMDPRLDTYSLKSPKLTLEANKIGTLVFTIFPSHPNYNDIKARRNWFTVYAENKLVYMGRPIYSKRAFKNGMDYKCEEITAVMNDYMFRPVSFSGDVVDLFLQVIASINNRSQQAQFDPGYIMNPGTVEWGPNKGYMGHWDVLQSFVKEFGGYVVPRYEDGKIYIDWMKEDDLPSATQRIRFGENMKDMFIETDTIESYSGVIPIGGVPEGATEKIDITSVNGGMDAIYNADAVDLYGIRETVREWPTITDPGELMEAGNEWIRGSAVQFRKTVQLKAVDLHNLDMTIEAFPFMHWITAESSRHDLSAKYILSREEIPLDKPIGVEINLGDTRRTLSQNAIGG